MNKTALDFLINFSTNVEEITFKPEWANGTGYFDHVVKGEHAPSLTAGETKTCVDGFGRRLVLVGTAVGNVVVFQRFKPGDTGVVTFNAPMSLEQLLGFNGSLNTDQVEMITGDQGGYPNVGRRLDALLKSIK